MSPDDTRYHDPIKLGDVRSRRIRAGRAIVQPIGRPDCLFATSGPAPLPTREELHTEALMSHLKSTEPKPRAWERVLLVVALLSSLGGVLYFIAKAVP